MAKTSNLGALRPVQFRAVAFGSNATHTAIY
nr:MAG TPA: hypothetical protein [Bacteriophage sp.]